jgi:hypothetical protein
MSTYIYLPEKNILFPAIFLWSILSEKIVLVSYQEITLEKRVINRNYNEAH